MMRKSISHDKEPPAKSPAAGCRRCCTAVGNISTSMYVWKRGYFGCWLVLYHYMLLVPRTAGALALCTYCHRALGGSTWWLRGVLGQVEQGSLRFPATSTVAKIKTEKVKTSNIVKSSLLSHGETASNMYKKNLSTK